MMEELGKWLELHYIELLAALGIGGSSGIASKKLIDRNQDKNIKELTNKVNVMDNKISAFEADLNANNINDKNFRSNQDERHNDLKATLAEIKKSQETLMNHIVTLMQKK